MGRRQKRKFQIIKDVMASPSAASLRPSDKPLLCVGSFTRELCKAYLKYLSLLQKKESSSESSLTESLSSTKYGSVSEKSVTCLLKCLQQCNYRKCNGCIRSLTWAEFCLVAVELLFDSKQPQTSPHVSPAYLSCGSTQTRKNEENTVFLGGSCNPTVWRKDICIPLLEAAGIKYYNPQVDEWYPELINIEQQAKRDAVILLFIVDAQTRAISSMVEISFLLGAGRLLVVVIDDINDKKPLQICGQALCNEEVTDLNWGRCALREILRLHSVIVEQSIAEGTQTVIDLLNHRLSSDDLAKKCFTRRNEDKEEMKAKRICDQLISIDDLLELYRNNINHLSDTSAQVELKLQTMINHEDPLVASIASILIPNNHDNSIDPSSTNVDPPSTSINPSSPSANPPSPSVNPPFTSIDPPSPSINPPSTFIDPLPTTGVHRSNPSTVVTSTSTSTTECICTSDDHSNHTLFSTFCVCLSELKYRAILQKRHGFDESLGSMVCTPLKWFTDWVLTTPSPTMSPIGGSTKCDVYLGGSCGNSQWRNTIAIPLLRKNNISFINPFVSEWNHSTLKLESSIKDSCTILLYVITGETLSIESLIEAAYYIGIGRHVVLAVQDIPIGENGFASIHDMKFNETHLKDYNRGRSYLRGLAKSAGVLVHDQPLDAVMCCIQMIHKQDEHQVGVVNSSKRGTKRPLSLSPPSD